MEEEIVGVIYILTNPSFPDYVKIGYTDDIDRRLEELNRSECIPFAFRVHATYGVTQRLQDRKLHEIIDTLNPELRAIEMFDGKRREKEFYALSAEDAYGILEGIAEISGTKHRLHVPRPEEHEKRDEELAAEIQEESRERKSNFSFAKCGIEAGAQITLSGKPEIVATVKNDRKVEYESKSYYLSALAQKLLGAPGPLQGPAYWEYEGRRLIDIREEREQQGTYM